MFCFIQSSYFTEFVQRYSEHVTSLGIVILKIYSHTFNKNLETHITCICYFVLLFSWKGVRVKVKLYWSGKTRYWFITEIAVPPTPLTL